MKFVKFFLKSGLTKMEETKDKAELVRNLNKHFAETLKLIEKSSTDNNAQIREEVKQFFACAEEIEKEIAKKEVSDIDYVKQCELNEIRTQKRNVMEFIDKFDREIELIEGNIRQCVLENSAILKC